MKQMAFDLEIAKLLPQDAQDLLAHRPLGISCAATLAGDQGEPRLWFSRSGEAGYLPQMTVADVQALVQYLSTAVANGYTLFTWNGLGFDSEHPGRRVADDGCAVQRAGAAAHRHVLPSVLPPWVWAGPGRCGQGVAVAGQAGRDGWRTGPADVAGR